MKRGGVEVVHGLIRGERGEARVERDDWPDRFLVVVRFDVRFVCGVRGLGLLALQLALALHLQLVRGGVHGYLEREHVLPAGDVPNLAGLDALDPFLDFKLKLRRGERNVVAAGPTTRHPIGTRAFRAGHHLQQVLEVFHRVLLPSSAELGVAFTHELLEHPGLDRGDWVLR